MDGDARKVMDGAVQERTRESHHESWLRRHALVIGVAVIGVCAFVLFSWGEWGFFCDQARTHHQACGSFWSKEHLHDWSYNAASNWQSEMLFGILLLVVLLKVEGEEGADRGDT